MLRVPRRITNHSVFFHASREDEGVVPRRGGMMKRIFGHWITMNLARTIRDPSSSSSISLSLSSDRILEEIFIFDGPVMAVFREQLRGFIDEMVSTLGWTSISSL